MNQEKTKARKQNMRIYSLYRTIATDIVFYYAIEFLFLTQVKQIDASDVVLSSSFYAIFMILFQIPASIVVDKIGTRKCTILANVFNIFYLVLIIFSTNLTSLIIAQFVSAVCFALKDISDPTMLRYSIPDTKKKGEIYSKIEGAGNKNYFYFDALTSIGAGFLYVVNPYIPILIALGFAIAATCMSLGFTEIEKKKKKAEDAWQEIKTYGKGLKKGIAFIVKSQRLRSLFLYMGITWGVFCLIGTYKSSLLVDIGASAPTISIIVALLGIASGIGSKKQVAFHNQFRNHSLSILLIATTISILVAGIVGAINPSYAFSLILISICMIVKSVTKGMTLVLTTRYLGNFSNEKILTQILAVNAISKNIFRALFGFLGAYLLKITNTANSMIVVGIILLITALGLISYMKTRVGLKPEEYDSKEIYKEPVKQ